MSEPSLADRLRRQAAHCGRLGSPLYADLLERCARDADAGGAVPDVLRGAEGPVGSVVGLRLLAALHRLVLTRRAPALALHYPTVGGRPGPDVADVALATVAEHVETLRPLVRLPVQTNEVGRTAALLGGLLHLAGRDRRPVRLLEVGASAGLALQVGAYAVHAGDGRVLGDPASPVQLRDAWVGPPPRAAAGLPRIVERRGCDPQPVDPTTEEGRLALSSAVWADQVERFARLGAALRVAADVPATVDRSGGADWLAQHLADPRPDVLTVVWHAVVWQYVPPGERARMLEVLAASRDVAHLRLEPEGDRTGQPHVLRLTTWPDGHDLVLGRAPGHGLPVTWEGSGG